MNTQNSIQLDRIEARLDEAERSAEQLIAQVRKLLGATDTLISQVEVQG